ncbi:hypothetical protein ACWGI8_36315 [Streptomyces sp. NPDC054841]
MKRSIALALASVPMLLATGMVPTAYAADEPAGGGKEVKYKVTTYVGDPVDVAPGADATATVHCPEGSIATGGGGVITDSDTTFLTATFPAGDDGLPFVGENPGSWSVYARNTAAPGGPASQVEAYVVCVKKEKDDKGKEKP